MKNIKLSIILLIAAVKTWGVYDILVNGPKGKMVINSPEGSTGFALQILTLRMVP